MKNYIKLNSLFKNYYAFLDTKECSARKIFIRHNIKVEFKKKIGLMQDSRYVIIFCKINKRDDDTFIKTLEELKRQILACGYSDYENACMEMQNTFYGRTDVIE